jgi:hypothetical protein
MSNKTRWMKHRWEWVVALVCLAAAAAPAGQTNNTAPAPAQPTKKYPAHWGAPPQVQTRDLVDLAPGYGRGSSTLAKWIIENTDKDTTPTNVAAQVLFLCDFQAAETNKVPEEFLVLDGAFAVKADHANKFLELPGAPLDSFGAMFGPPTSNSVAVSARAFGTNKGKRQPVFGLGLNGAGGLKLLVAPGKRVLELVHGDETKAQSAFKWEPGCWLRLRLQWRQIGAKEWQAEGKAWREEAAEPTGWQVVWRTTSDLAPGRSTLWASPISGTPIRFDDLKVTTIGR